MVSETVDDAVAKAPSLTARMLRAALSAAAALPLPVLRRVGAISGLVAWVTNRRGAKVCRENIDLCFPSMSSTARRRLARDAMMHAGRTVAESAIAWTRSPAACLELITSIAGEDAVDRIDGARIFIIPHLGNWEVLNHYLGGRYPLTHMYQPFSVPVAETVIQEARQRSGNCFVPVDRSGIRAQRRCLSAGGAIGAMPDQEPPVHTGEFAPFFSQAALTSTLIPELCRRTGATPVIATCLRGEDGFRIEMTVIETPLDTTMMNAAMERAIRTAPEQYLWTYKRFRTRPPGESERYQFRDPAVRVIAGKATASMASRLALMAGLARSRAVAGAGAATACRFRLRALRDARTNLRATGLAESLAAASVQESAKSVAEIPLIWLRRETGKTIITSVKNAPELRGAVVLTPPLGNREAVLRYLSEQNRVIEYYHPAARTAADDRIRARRCAAGIALAPETAKGIQLLVGAVKRGDTVTLGPDQQPRLRSGCFVPFFGVPALTALALPTLLQSTGAPCFIAVAWRVSTGFELAFHPVDSDREDPATLLTNINRQLEELISCAPEQYRWSDRRFNIRPPGERKLY